MSMSKSNFKCSTINIGTEYIMMIQLIQAGILFHAFNILMLYNVILYKYILIY